MLERIGGRKVAAGIVIVLVGLIVTAIAGDVPANLLALLQVVFGAFVLGNGFEHAAGAFAAKGAAPQAVDHSETLETLQAQAEAQAEAIATTQQGVAAILKIAGSYQQR